MINDESYLQIGKRGVLIEKRNMERCLIHELMKKRYVHDKSCKKKKQKQKHLKTWNTHRTTAWHLRCKHRGCKNYRPLNLCTVLLWKTRFNIMALFFWSTLLGEFHFFILDSDKTLVLNVKIRRKIKIFGLIFQLYILLSES